MKFTVVYAPLADYQLADIWMRCANQNDVTAASHDIDRCLRQNPNQIGEPDENGWRLLVVPPLVVTFEVSEDDRLATVLSVRYRP